MHFVGMMGKAFLVDHIVTEHGTGQRSRPENTRSRPRYAVGDADFRAKTAMARLLLIVLLWLPAFCPAATPPDNQPQSKARVLFIGNSLIYVNYLPRMLSALAASQPEGPRIETATFVAPGGNLAERWDDGHAAEAMRNGAWDVLVLQERGGLLACMADADTRQAPECRNSQRAHRQFVELAKTRRMRVVLLATWGPDALWQQKLDLGLRALARGNDAEVLPAATVLRAYAATHPQPPLFDAGFHTSVQGSLILAAQLYRFISGRDARARDVILDFPLLPPNALINPDGPLESQPQNAGDGKRIVIKADALAPLIQAAQR